jgi:hypothetical protein
MEAELAAELEREAREVRVRPIKGDDDVDFSGQRTAGAKNDSKALVLSEADVQQDAKDGAQDGTRLFTQHPTSVFWLCKICQGDLKCHHIPTQLEILRW